MLTKGEKIHEHWQLSPSMKIFYLRVWRSVHQRDEPRTRIGETFSSSLHFPSTTKEARGRRKATERRPTAFFFCLIIATVSHAWESALEGIYRLAQWLMAAYQVAVSSLAWPPCLSHCSHLRIRKHGLKHIWMFGRDGGSQAEGADLPVL